MSETPRSEQPEQTQEDKILDELLEGFKQEIAEIVEKTEEFKDQPEELKRWREQKDREMMVKNIERRSETSNEKILKIRQEAERAGIDLNDLETLYGIGNVCLRDLNKLFGEKYNLSVPQEKLPLVIPLDTDVPFFAEYKDNKGEDKQMIAVGTANDFLNGNYISEELAHFYRFNFQPEQKDEYLTDEFFGFLGRKMFRKAVSEGAPFAELDNDEGQDVSPKRSVIDLIKHTKKHIKIFEKMIEEEADKPQKIMLQRRLEELKASRESLTKHHRAYEFALKTDINKISDWQKLFSMPNEEVRRRFFTADQDYSGL